MIWISLAFAGDAYDRLKLRDGASCEGLDVAELLVLAEADIAPTYVPMRAADCLLASHATDPIVAEHARAWVREERWLGLGLLVGRQIDRFPLEAALAIAADAQDARVVRRLGESIRPEVRAVVEKGPTSR
jgi:hypothetical protein